MLRAWASGLFNRETVKDDAVAGLVLGVESVPDGLAGGLLAGVNPIFGLYAYMTGTITGALFTSSTFMTVQATGAMAIVVSDVTVIRTADNPDRALFTLAVMTGIVMLAAGIFKLGTLLRWVSSPVMVGFINAVGVNIVLGQLENLTGYEAEGANRVLRAFDTLFSPGQLHWLSILVGVSTIALIIVFERTRLGPLGMVVAIIATSGIVAGFGWDVMQLRDITEVPRALPLPVFPDLRLIPGLLVPAIALGFVGLVQGAGISVNFPNPDGEFPDASQDFSGQGLANIAAGVLQGMPVGGSMSASSLVKTAGAKSKAALLIAGTVMAILILVFGNVVGYISMPALAALLMVVGVRTVKPHDIKSTLLAGRSSAVVMLVTFVLTMIIPLQNAVMVGIGISVILYVVRMSNRITVKQWTIDDKGLKESDPPSQIGANEVIVLQPYGSLFFAAAALFEEALPEVTEDTDHAVVIIRLRGKDDLGATFMEVLGRYADLLANANSKMMIVYSNERVSDQLEATGVASKIGEENTFASDEWVGSTVRRAYQDALAWVDNVGGDPNGGEQ